MSPEYLWPSEILWLLGTIGFLEYVGLGTWVIYLVARKKKYNLENNDATLIQLINKDYRLEVNSIGDLNSQLQEKLDMMIKDHTRLRKALFWPVVILFIFGMKNVLYPGDLGWEFGFLFLLIAFASFGVVLIWRLLCFNFCIPVQKLKSFKSG